jgi:hypothetical protein
MPYNSFCYIEDRKLKDEIKWGPLSALKANKNQLYIHADDKILELS